MDKFAHRSHRRRATVAHRDLGRRRCTDACNDLTGANRDAIEQALADKRDAALKAVRQEIPDFDARADEEKYKESTSVDPQKTLSEAMKGNSNACKKEGNSVANGDAVSRKDTRKRSNHTPERVIARLKRDKADEALTAEVRERAGFLLAGIEKGEVLWSAAQSRSTDPGGQPAFARVPVTESDPVAPNAKQKKPSSQSLGDLLAGVEPEISEKAGFHGVTPTESQ